ERGGSGTFTSKDAANIKSVRLMRPSASTHVTDVDQRSIALDFEADGDKLTVTVPKNRNLVQAGWYLLLVTGADRTPSKAQWVQGPQPRPGAPAPTRPGCPPSRRAPLSASARCGGLSVSRSPGRGPGRSPATTGPPSGRPCTRRPTPRAA